MSLTKVTYSMISGAPANILDFGADPTGTNDSSSAITAALAASDNVYIPTGTYKIDSTINVGAQKFIFGEGRGNSNLNYTGNGAAFYCGGTTTGVYYYDIHIKDIQIQMAKSGEYCIQMEHCVHFSLDDLGVYGSWNPYTETPVGTGIWIGDGSFIGKVTHCDVRGMRIGMKFTGTNTSASDWAAAILVHGQGEIADVVVGVQIGSADVPYTTGPAITIRDYTIEGCTGYGVIVYSGDNVLIDGNYFEANDIVDVIIGPDSSAIPSPVCPDPIGIKVCNNGMNASAGYGVVVRAGLFTKIRDNNISRDDTTNCIRVDANAQYTYISGNRLNNVGPSTNLLTDNGVATYTCFDNSENPRPTGYYKKTLTLLNSWANIGGVWSTAGFYVTTDVVGIQTVHLTGTIENGLVSTVIATLPAQYRPPKQMQFGTSEGNNIRVYAYGDIFCLTKASSIVSLDGISWVVDL